MPVRVPFLQKPGGGVRSRAWAFWVNGVAASPLLTLARRKQLYRACGIDVETHLVYPRCYIHGPDVRIGADALLNHGVHLENVARIEIGPRTALGPFVLVLTSSHALGDGSARAGAWNWAPVTIGAGCWLGARSVILPGVTVGDGCVVAAGAVVREDCEPHGLYAGVPARRVRDLEDPSPREPPG